MENATGEIMVKVHGWQDGPGDIYSDNTLTATETIIYNWSRWTFVSLHTADDKLSGTINFAAILKDLVAKGIINQNDYVSGVELGSEMMQGSGSLQVNNFSVTESIRLNERNRE